MKQPRRDATSEQNKKVIHDYFQRSDVSTNLPTAKRIKKDDIERRVLDRPLTEVYKQFKEDHVDMKASFSTFVKNKPCNVQSTRKLPWFGCLCESCANVDLKLKALAQVAARSGSTIKVKDKYQATSITMCDKDESAFHKLQCIQRQCHHCGCDGIVRYYQPLAEQNSMATVVYSKWERVKKLYKGKEVTQIMPVSHTGSVTEVVLNLAEELKTFAEHLFVAAWQQKQFLMLQKNVPKSWAVLNMDFAENYTCIAQKEVQSAHWSHNQVTIHPNVSYYRCQEEDCEDIVTEHLIFVSDDKVHDAAAVQGFVKLANQHLIQKRGINIIKEIQLTDGCSAQYKSKVPFTDISCSQTDFGFPIERHFYGSRHGKGPSDGAGAVVKSAVRRAVMGGNVVVNDANEFFEVAKQKLSKEDTDYKEHFKRTLFLVTDDINHDRPERSVKCCKTLKGTRKVQAVQPVDKMIIKTRNLSCFCEGCIDGVEQACVNSNYVHDWVLNDIRKVPKDVPRGRARPAIRGRGRGRSIQRGRGRDVIGRGRGRGTNKRAGGRGGAPRFVNRRRDHSSSSESDGLVTDLDTDSNEDEIASKSESDEDFDKSRSNMSDPSASAGVRMRGGARTRGGTRTRGGVRTRGGKANIQQDPSTSQAVSDIPFSEIVVTCTELKEPGTLNVDENLVIDSSFEFDGVDTIETMDIADILDVINESIGEAEQTSGNQTEQQYCDQSIKLSSDLSQPTSAFESQKPCSDQFDNPPVYQIQILCRCKLIFIFIFCVYNPTIYICF